MLNFTILLLSLYRKPVLKNYRLYNIMDFILFKICINHNIHLDLTKNANKLFIINFINHSLNKTLKCTNVLRTIKKKI